MSDSIRVASLLRYASGQPFICSRRLTWPGVSSRALFFSGLLAVISTNFRFVGNAAYLFRLMSYLKMALGFLVAEKIVCYSVTLFSICWRIELNFPILGRLVSCTRRYLIYTSLLCHKSSQKHWYLRLEHWEKLSLPARHCITSANYEFDCEFCSSERSWTLLKRTDLTGIIFIIKLFSWKPALPKLKKWYRAGVISELLQFFVLQLEDGQSCPVFLWRENLFSSGVAYAGKNKHLECV